MTQNSFRKHLSMPGMLSEVRECFDSIPDPIVSRGITLSGCLMTALGVFSLKMTSLLSLRFVRTRVANRQKTLKGSLRYFVDRTATRKGS